MMLEIERSSKVDNVFDVLKERGYVEQSTNENEVRAMLGKAPVTFYIGFDPTADSLHVGHFIQIMVMMHLQKAGHRPLALVGGATGAIGDPSGRTDMRKMLTQKDVDHNVACFKKQFARFLDFEGENGAMIINNADWLLDLNYLQFITEYGKYFSVNRMLTAECFKSRLEKGLTFLEFNYMLMQSYDYLELYRRYGCMLQMGGNDQWSNILSGADLIRRVEGQPAHALTFKLLVTSAGKKMGKTESGAVWLDPQKTTPYEFYQYWRNIDDADVGNCLALLTFIPMDEVKRLTAFQTGKEINHAKEILAYTLTELVHGKNEADKAQEAARALFGGDGISENMPAKTITKTELIGMDILTLLTTCELISSNSEGRRLIKDGGIYLNSQRVSDFAQNICEADLKDNKLMLRKGKKVYFQVIAD
jgi:tyrosyl-tRNA synthetase